MMLRGPCITSVWLHRACSIRSLPTRGGLGRPRVTTQLSSGFGSQPSMDALSLKATSTKTEAPQLGWGAVQSTYVYGCGSSCQCRFVLGEDETDVGVTDVGVTDATKQTRGGGYCRHSRQLCVHHLVTAPAHSSIECALVLTFTTAQSEWWQLRIRERDR